MSEDYFIHEDICCELMLTTNCNLFCKYCIAQDIDKNAMSIDCGESAVDMFVSLGEGAKNIEFVFTGGEPLLNFATLENIVAYSDSKSREFSMNPLFVVKTNGTLIDEKVIALFKKYGVKAVISIDGLPEYHNENRTSYNGKPTQEIIVKNIQELQKNSIPCSASLTVHPIFAKHIIHNVQYLYGLGLNDIDIGPVYGKVDWTKSQIDDFTQALGRCADFLHQTKENEYIEIGPLYKNSEHVYNNLTNCWGCKAGLSNLAFMPNGNIAGCSSLAMLSGMFPEMIIGDIESGIDEVALQNLFSYSQATEDTRPSCTICNTKNNCAGGCMAINLSASQDPLIPPKFYCEIISTISEKWHTAWG